MNHECAILDLRSQIRHLNDHWDCGVVEVIDDPVEVEEFMSEFYISVSGIEPIYNQLCVVKFDYDVDLLRYDHNKTPTELFQYILEVSEAINQHMSRGGHKLYIAAYGLPHEPNQNFYYMVFARAASNQAAL